ncbi:hypothetical protein Tco_1144184 [Tanacetum coccineum]
METVLRSIDCERAQHKMQYESRVNERQNQNNREKTDTSNVLEAKIQLSLEAMGTESKEAGIQAADQE